MNANTKKLLMIAGVAVVGYFIWKKYQDSKNIGTEVTALDEKSEESLEKE